ncbi:hypothetical protein [Sulfuracidifex metallicus]|uniref:Uncharacterized protein n=1 Tax=Sulfuracidifex metallicus DSM 6482 = JCM 9184 TaxID=523847 RepID=A0A6A9QLN8_SULME|nr:hypothetical protein [Sulfuracidifex metallicus]MUN28155.1 hypothetical protein [Sulfuracidifex metallicus DSM 6482 = JCM 9184]WOE51310.1 hypothetical protein RQ359_000581 [Sulfuracidifex metallicus DSM 6482 = JCM 9184]
MTDGNEIIMKGRDLESLVFMGRLKSVNVEFCDDEKKLARVVGITDTNEKVSTECVPIRAAGKISTVIKHYLRLGVGNYIISNEKVSSSNVDTEEDENGSENS